MSTKWTSEALSQGEIKPTRPVMTPGEKFVVLLLYGKNSFGDKIYSYLKITLGDLQRLKDAAKAGSGFNPSDYGSVIAAGRGEPTPEVKAEVSSMFEVVDAQGGGAKPDPNIPAEKKNWDEY